MEYNFNKTSNNSVLKVKIGDHTILRVTWFKYLVSIIQNDGKIERYANHRIQVGG